MLLETYRKKFEESLPDAICRFGEKNDLRDACEYALLSRGKRLRPILVMITAEAQGLGFSAMEAALGVEFFHTASLIADDLPCMDNEDFRRDRKALHKVYGEAVAILASYTLIAEGYGSIYRSGKMLPDGDRAVSLGLEVATRTAGIQGATSGQFLDLFPPNHHLSTIQKVIDQKTITLFEISFIFGWLFGGGDPNQIGKLSKLARHLGMAFQIADDLKDREQDGNKGLNIASCLGIEKAMSLFEKETALFKTSLEELHLWTKPFQEIYEFLTSCRLGLFVSHS